MNISFTIYLFPMYTNVLNNGGFFAITSVKGDCVIYYSIDGKNWVACPPTFPADRLKYIFRVDNILIAIAPHKKFIYTFDCITWKECIYELTDEQKELKLTYYGVDIFDKHIIGFEDDCAGLLVNKYYSLDVIILNDNVEIIFNHLIDIDLEAHDTVDNIGAIQYNDKLIIHGTQRS